MLFVTFFNQKPELEAVVGGVFLVGDDGWYGKKGKGP